MPLQGSAAIIPAAPAILRASRRVNVTLPNRSSFNMAFVSFHAIDEFPGISSIPFLYDGPFPFFATSCGKISKVAPTCPESLRFFANPSRNRNTISGETPIPDPGGTRTLVLDLRP
jgi:hypothetical protein